LGAVRQTQQGRLTGYLTGANQQQQDFQNKYRQWQDSYNQWRQQGQDRFTEKIQLV
jgi:Skp family chaperone for outer membrane proteins